MSAYGYDEQVDLLMIEVPEVLALAEFSTDNEKRVIPTVLVGQFGSLVDCALRDDDLYRGTAQQRVVDASPDRDDLVRRACSVVETWAADDTPEMRDLVGAAFFEAFDEEGLERLAPHVGPATWAALQAMEEAQFAGRKQPKV